MRTTTGTPDFWGKKFHFPRVSRGDQPLNVEPVDSGNEIGKMRFFTMFITAVCFMFLINWPLFIIQVVVFLYVDFRLGYSRLISFCLLFCQFTGKTS